MVGVEDFFCSDVVGNSPCLYQRYTIKGMNPTSTAGLVLGRAPKKPPRAIAFESVFDGGGDLAVERERSHYRVFFLLPYR